MTKEYTIDEDMDLFETKVGYEDEADDKSTSSVPQISKEAAARIMAEFAK